MRMALGEDTKIIVRESMQEQQEGLLQLAASNANRIAEQASQASARQVREDLDTDAQRSKLYENLTWNNNINKSNFNFTQQVKDLWERTERAVADGQSDKAKEYINKGKDLCKKRLKVLRYADRDEWDAALEYLSDDLAEDECDRKRMRKAKKTSENKKSTKKRAAAQREEKKHSADKKVYSAENQRSGDAVPRNALVNVTC